MTENSSSAGGKKAIKVFNPDSKNSPANSPATGKASRSPKSTDKKTLSNSFATLLNELGQPLEPEQSPAKSESPPMSSSPGESDQVTLASMESPEQSPEQETEIASQTSEQEDPEDASPEQEEQEEPEGLEEDPEQEPEQEPEEPVSTPPLESRDQYHLLIIPPEGSVLCESFDDPQEILDAISRHSAGPVALDEIDQYGIRVFYGQMLNLLGDVRSGRIALEQDGQLHELVAPAASFERLAPGTFLPADESHEPDPAELPVDKPLSGFDLFSDDDRLF